MTRYAIEVFDVEKKVFVPLTKGKKITKIRFVAHPEGDYVLDGTNYIPYCHVNPSNDFERLMHRLRIRQLSNVLMNTELLLLKAYGAIDDRDNLEDILITILEYVNSAYKQTEGELDG
jgi:hypothetical protein